MDITKFANELEAGYKRRRRAEAKFGKTSALETAFKLINWIEQLEEKDAIELCVVLRYRRHLANEIYNKIIAQKESKFTSK